MIDCVPTINLNEVRQYHKQEFITNTIILSKLPPSLQSAQEKLTGWK